MDLLKRIEELEQDIEYLGEKIDDGINTDRIAVWLYSDLSLLVKYVKELLIEIEKLLGHEIRVKNEEKY